MWLSKLSAMSIGPLWLTRPEKQLSQQVPEQAPKQVPDFSDVGQESDRCTYCGTPWVLEQVEPERPLLALLVFCNRITEGPQQNLLDNLMKASALQGRVDCMSLHLDCSELSAGIDMLNRRLASVSVKFVVVFGSTLQIASSFGTQFQRGQLYKWHETNLLVTHPVEQLLAAPTLKAQTWTDLCVMLVPA